MSGYVRIHRALIGHPAFRNDSEAMAFAWMVVRAAWKPVRVRYKERGIHLQRGQLSVSQRDMAAALDRDKAWVERLWKRLRAEAMIDVTLEAGVAVITIRNYDEYQAESDTREAVNEAGARQAQGTEQRREEGKKEEKDANASSSACLETDQAVADWNMAASQAGWQTIKKLSDPRKRLLRAVLREHGLDGWRAGLARATASGLLGARPPPTWFNFDFVVKPANFLKLIEGNYDRPWQSHSQPVGGFRPHAGLALIASANEDERAQGFTGDEADCRGAFPEVPGAVRH